MYESDWGYDAFEFDVDSLLSSYHYHWGFHHCFAIYRNEVGKGKRWIRDSEFLEIIPTKLQTIIYLILLVLGGALGFATWFWMNRTDTISQICSVLMICVLLVYLIELMFVFAVQAKFVNPVFQTMKNALVMGIQNLPITLLCAVGVGLLIGLNATFFVANILTLVIGVGALGWVLGMFYNLAFRKYLPKEEKKDDEWHVPEEEVTETEVNGME